MREVFVDTSAWMAILDAADVNHRSSVAFQGEIVGACQLIVTNYILDELYTVDGDGMTVCCRALPNRASLS